MTAGDRGISRRYESFKTVTGALRRGLGRGAVRARDEPAAVPALYEWDGRWDSVDQRAVYLARLVRDLALPVGPLIDLVRSPATPGKIFGNAVDLLIELGRGGDERARDGLRAYVREGPEWIAVLEQIAAEWPPETWNDLSAVAGERLPGSGGTVLGNHRPWRDWPGFDAPRPRHRPGPPPERESPLPPLGQESDGALLRLVRGGSEAALREINRRGPQPALLPLLDELTGDDLASEVGRALHKLGVQGRPLVRRWAVERPTSWTVASMLAEHGDESDLPAIFAAWDRLDADPDDQCGYNTLAAGVARIGGPAAAVAVPRLRRLWFSPHSYERAAYLSALLALDPEEARQPLFEGLWDCESEVRRIAAEQVPLTDVTREQLRYLRDDPMETAGVRTAAEQRLVVSGEPPS